MTVDLPEPAATIYELTEKLREDLMFAAPEAWALHIERRLAEAFDAGDAAHVHSSDCRECRRYAYNPSLDEALNSGDGTYRP